MVSLYVFLFESLSLVTISKHAIICFHMCWASDQVSMSVKMVMLYDFQDCRSMGGGGCRFLGDELKVSEEMAHIEMVKAPELIGGFVFRFLS